MFSHAPSFQQGYNTTHEKQPHSPTWSPETASWSFPDWPSVETIVDQMFQIFGHTNLSHKLTNKVSKFSLSSVRQYLVFVSVHSCQRSHMCKDVLHGVGQLECINITQAELHMGVHNKLRQTQDLAAQMESVSETGFFALLRRKGPDKISVSVTDKNKL